jgi:hypothetical protein
MKMGVLFLTTMLCIGLAQAAEDEVKVLIQGCAEVETIYDRRGERNLLAGVNTSVAEALRAGYCQGVLKQYRRANGCYTDWVDQARRIGSVSESKRVSIEQLLRNTCG